MKTLKKTMLITLASLMLGISSCKKYEEGPSFSLRTKKARVANTWKRDKVFWNNQELTGPGLNEDISIFEKDGTAIDTDGITEYKYKWEFGNKKESIIFIYNNQGAEYKDEWKILKLKNDEMWLKQEDAGVTSKIHYITND